MTNLPRTPHLAFPPRTITLPDGRVTFATVEQGTDDEIRAGLALACGVRYDELPWDEELGTPDVLAVVDPAQAAAQLQAALEDLDQRAPIRVRVIDDQTAGRQIALAVGIAATTADQEHQEDVDG